MESPDTATTVDEWWRRSIELVLRERVLGDGAATALLVSLQGRVADVERARAERLPGIAERRRQLALQLEHLQREMEGLRGRKTTSTGPA